MNKKVLFVAYHFPPDSAVGALRTQKFVKYLPECGWQPFVLTVKEKYYPILEPKRLDDVNGAVIERTSFWRTPLQLAIDIRDKYILKKCSELKLASPVAPNLRTKNIGPLTYIKYFLAGLNWFPDDRLYWLIPSFRKGIRLIKKNDIRTIVVSAPPHSSIILAYLLAVWAGSKLVIDFRDPWRLSGVRSDCASFKPNLLLKIESVIQKKILKRTSAVLTTNDFFRNALLQQNSFLSR